MPSITPHSQAPRIRPLLFECASNLRVIPFYFIRSPFLWAHRLSPFIIPVNSSNTTKSSIRHCLHPRLLPFAYLRVWDSTPCTHGNRICVSSNTSSFRMNLLTSVSFDSPFEISTSRREHSCPSSLLPSATRSLWGQQLPIQGQSVGPPSHRHGRSELGYVGCLLACPTWFLTSISRDVIICGNLAMLSMSSLSPGLSCAHPPPAIFTYDYLLTLSREVTYMWRRPVPFTSTAYFTARYAPFIGLLYRTMIVDVNPNLASVCHCFLEHRADSNTHIVHSNTSRSGLYEHSFKSSHRRYVPF